MLSVNVFNSAFFKLLCSFRRGKQRYEVILVVFRSGFKRFESLDWHEIYRNLFIKLDNRKKCNINNILSSS
jgi:hypothetical protein